MLSHLLESLFFHTNATQATEAFIYLVIAVFVVACFCERKNNHLKFVSYAPTLMGALGILGTFVGIIIGLLNFDTHNIDKSIPVLLGGLKTAFITSIVGMFFAMLFNAIDAFFFARKRVNSEEALPDEVTPEHIHTALVNQTKIMERMLAGVSGSEEGSLVGQIRLMRNDLSDEARAQRVRQEAFSQQLWQQLDNFAEVMARGATEQIIEALRQVITDFNNNLTEQFGENFKALDASVQKLVEWQENYRSQLTQMGEQYQQSVEALVETRAAIAGIWQECETIPQTMTSLHQVMEVNQHQIAELSRHLEAFASLRDKATEAVPQIHQQLDQVGELLKAGAQTVNTSLAETGEQLLNNANSMRVALDEGSEGFRQSVLQTQQAFASMAHDVSNSSETLAGTLTATLNDMKQGNEQFMRALESHSQQLHERMQNNGTSFIDALQESANQFNQQLTSKADNMLDMLGSSADKASSGLTTQIKESLERFGTTVNEQLKAFEQATDREMNQQMEILGKALLSISQGFIKNYDQMIKENQSAMGQVQNLLASNDARR